MKILFIIPPDTLRIESSVSEKLDRGRELRAPLGLLCVAAPIKGLEGVESILLDCSAMDYGYEQVREKIIETKPDIIALSALTFSLLDALRTARVAKKVDSNIKICLGGFHANLYPKESLNLKEIDFIVHGEGEYAFRKLVLTLKNGDSERLKTIKGIGFKNGEELFLNGPAEIIKEMDLLPMPAYNLLNLDKYSHILSKNGSSISMQTSRGCPFQCLFCDIRRTKLRLKSPEKVIEEIISLKKRGISDFFFVDDTITVHKARLKTLCELIIREGLEISYRMSARVDTVDMEMLKLLKQSGCNRISYGVESGNQRLLDYLEKRTTLEQIAKAFQMTREAGIQTFAFLIIGIPTETMEEMERSVDFVKSINSDYMNISICTPYPKTALYDKMLDDGLIPYDYWQSFAENPTEDFQVKFWNKDFTDEQLRHLQDRLMKRYYRSPVYILKELRKVNSKGEFLKKLKLGLRILKP